MPRLLTDTDIDALLFGSNSETDEENGSNYEPSSDEDEEDAIADNDSEQRSEEERDSVPSVRRPNISIRPTTVTLLTSKNGKEVSHTDPIVNGGSRRVSNVLKTAPGPTRYANRQVEKLRSSFQLFIRKLLIEIIFKWTNKGGRRLYKDKRNDVMVKELYKFIGFMVLIGVYKSKNKDNCQLLSLENGRPIFNKIMNWQHFKDVLRVLRYDDAEYRRQHSSDDKLEPIREYFELWVKTLLDGNVPGTVLTVDEELVTFRGRCPFKQYIPSKPGRYGIKFWILSDSKSSYVYNVETYTCKKPNAGREVNLGEKVVLNLLEGIDAAGRNDTCDKFFTCLSLAR